MNKPIKMIISSDDVIHSFYVPAVRLKKDAVPGMYSSISFIPNTLGEAQVFCAEYCGTSHSAMLAKVNIVTQEEFDDYMKEGPQLPDGMTMAQWGEKLFAQNNCNTCHSRDGSKSPGPDVPASVRPRRDDGDAGRDDADDRRDLHEGVDPAARRRRSSWASPPCRCRSSG